MSSSRPRRRATTAKSYKTDPFADLDLSDEDLSKTADAASPPDDDDSDPDAQLSSALSEPDEEDEDEIEASEEEDASEDDDFDISGDEVVPVKRGRGPGKKGKGLPKTPTEKRIPKFYLYPKPNAGTRKSQQSAPSRSDAAQLTNTPSAHFTTIKSRKKSRITSTFGKSRVALVKGVLVRDRWVDIPFVPTRERLLLGGISEEEKKEKERKKGWGEEQMKEEYLNDDKQVMREVALDELTEYLPEKKDDLIRAVIGPIDDPKLVEFPAFATQSLAAAVRHDKKGWFFNAAGDVSAMVFLSPDKPEDENETWYQYLLVATRNLVGREFDPQSGKCCLQLWRFVANRDGSLNPDEGNAGLVAVIAGNWGGTVDMVSVPLPLGFPNDNSLGRFIAVLGGDGQVHIIKIPLPSYAHNATISLLVESPSYLLTPHPGTPTNPTPYFTALTFPTPTTIALGLSNGYLSTYSLHPFHPIPTFHFPVHSALITSISSTSVPTLILTTSVSGTHQLTSLLRPATDHIASLRTRLPTPFITYSPLLDSALIWDESNAAKLAPLSRFNGAVLVSKHMGGGNIRDAAASSHHPFVLSCGWEGTALVANVVRRAFHGKGRAWQCIWFRCVWSVREEMIRILEGFKAEEVMRREGERGEDGEGVVWEKKAGVQRVAWMERGKSEVSAWAAAAVGCGLVRVEDLAVDTGGVEPTPEEEGLLVKPDDEEEEETKQEKEEIVGEKEGEVVAEGDKMEE
ncbi:hypothetical protein BJ508DRAFT_412218 [Ascobolus immersus RN42]|uniref:WD40 repeat-like protein n=1 Tax=Ascobolus immersus RN42 TaxID=1160509 RepID=A0A3N4IHH4_ASCIM|nr:hypothetical protein BJ508DRAFT_412218 [Ascobolus immersus RN42]